MRYTSGEVVKIGDNVLIEKGQTKGVVHAIIETPLDMLSWGLDDIGVSIESEPFGLVFWPLNETEDPVLFVSRAV